MLAATSSSRREEQHRSSTLSARKITLIKIAPADHRDDYPRVLLIRQGDTAAPGFIKRMIEAGALLSWPTLFS
jgi:hypothetical protein